jgi:choline dehydrogenase-like flavoprotein
LQRQAKLLNGLFELEPDYAPQSGLTDRVEALMDRNGGLIRRNGMIDAGTYHRFFQQHQALNHFSVLCVWEQSPNAGSRVTLSPERDFFGQKRVVLDWQISPADEEALHRTLELLAQEVGKAGIGRMKLDVGIRGSWPGGNHHMGTTRMHPDPRYGVVDQDCRVHGLSNLYVAGSSVFPTSGAINPTLTIIALAERLADHLKARSPA